ncbi:carboxypeptidase regulatory-like domain-containing protein [Agrococcus sp. TF02-05]|uniref:carboxypeptidase regulatory-like domain-containing protein n=1 Tax=Agrococcus sp. TF02-05 TaxID=2815211 RepID=UPI001AA0EA2C|nr:carboxypeptidase regulatory-like domain-containing protein [Agrococcus sp. TF02-05]MBO1769331.1 carboxypeptidase regulatory-like domain-containing protein [Agrococcus sp. TF02-05]
MGSLRERVRIAASGDRGMTLIEVMVAMFVFAILSTMVLSSLLQVLSTSRHSQAQHVAANLAAAEIDLAHDTPDIFQLLDTARDVTLNGTVFRVVRETAWVADTASDAACGAGGGSLRFKRVHVTVTWGNMRPGAEPVRADTIVNPAERINDPSKGTVLVSVIDSLGAGVPSARVTLTPTSGGVSGLYADTDAQGCAYVLQVPRGTYEVSVSKSGYTGILEETPRQRDVSVQAGSSTSIVLQYDLAGTFALTLAPGTTVRLPNAMPLTLLSTYGFKTVTLPSTSVAQSVRVHPRVTYRVFAGEFRQSGGAQCDAVDPSAWLEGTAGGVDLAAGSGVGTAAEPGTTAALGVPTGLVRLSSSTSNLRASVAAGRAGDPGCDAHAQLSFGSTTLPAGTILAVPYGTWRFHTSGGSNVAVTPVTRGEQRSSSTVTLDPREPAVAPTPTPTPSSTPSPTPTPAPTPTPTPAPSPSPTPGPRP